MEASDNGLGTEVDRAAPRRDFITALYWLLDERAISQRDLAEGMGWKSHATINPWRNLKAEPDPAEVFRLEKFLRVPAGTLSRHLGYMPVEARMVSGTSVEEAIDGDPMLPEWGRDMLKVNYRTIRNNYVHRPGRGRKAP